MKKHFTCIMCPIGCEIDVYIQNGEIISIKGNKCPQGKAFVIQELKEPMRVLTTTVRIKNGEYNMLPVRTDKSIPKRLLSEAMKEISKIKTSSPIKIYDVIAPNLLGTGANLVATRSMKKCRENSPDINKGSKTFSR